MSEDRSPYGHNAKVTKIVNLNDLGYKHHEKSNLDTYIAKPHLNDVYL